MQHGGEEAVGLVLVRQELEVLVHFERNLLLGQHLAHRHQIEVRVRCQEAFDDDVVFFIQQAAGGVHEAATVLDQARSAIEDRGLLFLHLGNRAQLLAPLDVRIAAQGAQARAWRIDQHAVDLAGQALDLGIALVRDQHRMHVRQTAARHARLQFGQALFGHVERVQATGVAHQCAQCQRLAASAGAEVDHHLAAARADDLRQHLAALVLHFDRAFLEQRQILQRRLLLDAQTQRRIRHRLGDDRRFEQRGDDGVALGLDRIDAQVERRRRVEHGSQFQGFGFAELGDQLVVQPLRQVGLHRTWQQRAIDFLDTGQEVGFIFGQATDRIDASRFGQAQQRQATHRWRAAMAGEIGEERLVTQHRIHGFGNHATLTAAKTRIVFEETRQGDVGWGGKTENLAQDFFSLGDDRWRQSHVNPWVVNCLLKTMRFKY